MKPKFYIVVFCLSFFAGGFCSGQNKPSDNSKSIWQDLFEPDSQTNMTFISYTNCPPQYTNVISNTNLFTLDEQKLLKEVLFKYKNVTTNSGPTGSVLTGLEKKNNYWVAHFSYTNLEAFEDIIFGDRSTEARHNGDYNDFIAGLGIPLAKFRTKDGNGYDATISRSSDMFSTFAEIKQGKVNGLFVDFSNGHCADLLRFVSGNAVGQWLQWDTYTDNHLLKVKIEAPLDYFKYMTREIKN